MLDNLKRLHNTLIMIETRGENTKIMADCLRYIEQMIEKESAKKEDKND